MAIDNAKPQSLEETFHSGSTGEGFNFNRRWVFIIALILTFIFITSVPLIGVPALILVVIFVFFTLKDPDCPINIIGDLSDDENGDDLLNMFSLYRVGSKVTSGNRELYDKFIDVLIKGGIIDVNTDPEEINLTVISSDPPTYELELNQIGKTERQLITACENALLAYSAYLVDVREIGGTNYRVTYLLESELDTLEKMNVTYTEMLSKLESQ